MTLPERVSLFAFRGFKPERGFSLIAAIFLLVVLSSLGAFMLRFSNVQQMTALEDVEGARIFHLAQAGADYWAYQVLQAGAGCAGTPVNPPFPGAYAITIQCHAAGPFAQSGSTIAVYQIVANACNGPVAGACPGNPDGLTYVERQFSLTISH